MPTVPDEVDELPPFIGQRTRQLRKLRGLTQRQLADLAGLSFSLVNKVEAGHRPASPGFVSRVARALRVEPSRLVTLPNPEGSEEIRRARAGLEAVRLELLAYQVPIDGGLPPRSLTELARDVHHASRLRQATRLHELGAILPGLLFELRVASQRAGGAERRRAYALRALAYDNAYGYTQQLTYDDLAIVATDRQTWAAEQSDDPLLLSAGAFRMGDCLVRAGDYAGTRALLAARLAELEPALRSRGNKDGNAPTLSVHGQLHLMSALAAARAGDTTACETHYAEAQASAGRLAEDRDDYLLCFGPTNVALWGVSLALEGHDSGVALERAAQVRLPTTMPVVRRAGFHFDLASACLLTGRLDECLEALQAARGLAAEYTRSHPMVRETLSQLIRARRRLADPLRHYAVWAGVAC